MAKLNESKYKNDLREGERKKEYQRNDEQIQEKGKVKYMIKGQW